MWLYVLPNARCEESRIRRGDPRARGTVDVRHGWLVVVVMAFHPQPKGEPGLITRHRRKVAAEAALKQAYADVDLRDGGRCWITGRYADPSSPDPRFRREHHHLKGRNVRPEWVTKPERIITVAREAHLLINAGYIVVEGTDARKPIFFHWREGLKADQKPFVIRGRRRPQEE